MKQFYYDDVYTFMDDYKNIFMFKKVFLSNNRVNILSSVLSDALHINKKFLLNNLEVYDINDEIYDLNYFKKPNLIVCYVGNIEFIVKMHKNTNEKILHKKISYCNMNYDVSDYDIHTYIIKVDT